MKKKHTISLTALAIIVTLLIISPPIVAAEPHFTAELTAVTAATADKITVRIHIGGIAGDGLIGLSLAVKFEPTAFTPVPAECGCANVPASWAQNFGDSTGGNVGYNADNVIILLYDSSAAPAKLTDESGAYITLTFAVNQNYVGPAEIGVYSAEGTILADGEPQNVVGSGNALRVFVGEPTYDLNGDGKLDVLDLIAFRTLFKNPNEDGGRYDFNCDGKLDEYDALWMQERILDDNSR